MKITTLRANSTIVLSSGQVKMTDEQYKTRKHNLETTDCEGVYTIKSNRHLNFKAGETFGLIGDVSKTMQTIVEELNVEGDDEPVVESRSYSRMSADKLKGLVESEGGEYVNKAQANEFLKAIDSDK
jgi:hypothetical protein